MEKKQEKLNYKLKKRICIEVLVNSPGGFAGFGAKLYIAANSEHDTKISKAKQCTILIYSAVLAMGQYIMKQLQC